MQFKKAVAIGLGTLVAGATFAFAGMAATDLSQVFPTTGTSALTGANTLVVVGASANPADIVGAIDVAARLGGTVTETKTISGTTSNVDGVEKDGVTICTSTTATNCNLDDAAGTGSAFPSGVVLTNTHYSGLKKSTISWNSNDYDYRERVDASGVTMSHDVTTDKVNGTETMVVESGDVFYEYVFDKALNISSKNNLGTISSPEYTYPIKVKLMGKDFQIVGVGTSSIKALAGNTGEASATNGITSGDYTVYATQGVSDSWAKIVVKDKTGTEVASKSISEGNSYDFSAQSLTVKVTDVRAIGTTGDISGVDVVVGATGSVEKEYDSTADVTSTGTASDVFPGDATKMWGIQVTGLSSAGTYPGVPKNARIQVVYKPSTTQYLKAGEKISLPNSYGELGYEGFNTDKFVTVTVSPFGGTSTYDVNSTADIVGNDQYGLEISSDVTGSIVSPAANTYDKAYVLFNKTMTGPAGYGQAFWIGYWDKTNSKVLVNRSSVDGGNGTYVNTNVTNVEYAMGFLNASSPNAVYPFRITYAGSGDADWYLNVTVNFTHGIQTVQVGSVPTGFFDVTAAFTNKTAGIPTASPQFRLGATSASAEDAEILGRTSGQTAQSIGKKTQDIVSDSEVVVVNSNSNGASDKLVFKVPSKRLAAKVYFGKLGASSTSNTYQNAIPVTTPVGKLTSDYTDATIGTTGKNLIFVGGPCANKFVATLMNTTADKCLTAWYSEVGATDAAGAKDKALVKVVENAFGSGKVALIVAGTDAKDTRNAAAKVMADGLTGSKYLYSTAASSSQ